MKPLGQELRETMNTSRYRRGLSFASTGWLLILLLAACYALMGADKPKPAAAKPAAAKPAAAAPAAKAGAPGHAGTPAGTAGRAGTPAGSAGRAGTPAGRAGTPAAGGRGGAPGSAGRGGSPAGRGGSPAMGRGGSSAMGHGGPAPRGSRDIHTRGGNDVRMRPGGRPGDVHVANRGMDIHHGLNGNRRVAVERPDHSRIVAERGGRGYVQRPYAFHGHEYGHRTYWAHGRAYDRFYRRYPYRGAFLDVYAPAFYYRPAFYGWAYNPWAVPIAYGWGWGASPWYGYYGAYFAPYPVYPSASFWLADYLISTSLAASYEAQAQANAAAAAQAASGLQPGAAALTPAVKDQIAAEVQRQIALENAEAGTPQAEPDPASSGLQRMLSDHVPHIFLAGHDLDVTDASGAECAVSEGDALRLDGSPAPDATAATLIVLSSKGGVECHAGSPVTVQFADLQDMQNHMREIIDQGMGELQAKQGKGGLPALPASANAPPVKSAFAAEAPPPEANAGAEINQQAQEADSAEKQVLSEVPAGGPSDASGQGAGITPPPPPVETQTVSLMGATPDAVTAALGQPVRIVDLGAKKIYVYKDMKVTFVNGKVTDVQ